ncbi:MAG: hypothetical protein Q9181_001788 [Wetmoreana brouardii]
MGSMSEPRNEIDVSIIGGGIAGVTLALGLLARGVPATVYERSESFREIGAGIGFTPNSERAMKVLDPRIHAAFKRVTVQNGTDWFMWMDGFTQGDYDAQSNGDKMIHKMYLGERGFEGCHRADFLDELIKMMPKDTIRFCKSLDTIDDLGDNGRVKLKFADGSSADTDVDEPASHPNYIHKYAFRGLVPMSAARPVLGLEKTETRHMYLGQNGHALTFPVAGNNLLNVVAFVTDHNDWLLPDKFTAPATKAEAVKAFAGFNSTVRAIIDLLPDQLDKWAIFDTYEHPPPTFAQGKVCIIGDAAHAAAPYHGAGAGFAIEDGAVLARLLDTAGSSLHGAGVDRSRAIDAALEAYNAVRIERARWLVESSRFVGEMYEWQDKTIGSDASKLAEEIEWRSRKIWDYDVEGMMGEANCEFDKRLEALLSSKTPAVIAS